MKKIMGIVVTLCILSVTAGAAVKEFRPNRQRAFRYLKTTAAFIFRAQKAVKEHKVYTGYLAKAALHQKIALKLYREGKYRQSIHHSRRARVLSIMAFKANIKEGAKDMELNKDEEKELGQLPTDESLDKEALLAFPDAVQDDSGITVTLAQLEPTL